MPFRLYAEERSTGTVPFLMPATLRPIVTECDRSPETPVTVTVEDIGLAEPAEVSVSILPPATPDGVKDAFTPAGSPAAVMMTLPANPFLGNTLMAVEALCPWVNERLEGEVEREKSPTPSVAGGSTS